MLGLGFEAMTSSTRYLRGGASDIWTDLFNKFKSMVNFIADYVPKFLRGFSDGFALTIFKSR